MAYEPRRPDGTVGYWGSPMRPGYGVPEDPAVERERAIEAVAEGIFVRTRIDAETCFRMALEFVEHRDRRRRSLARSLGNAPASGLDASGSIELGESKRPGPYEDRVWAIFSNGRPVMSFASMPLMFPKLEGALCAMRELALSEFGYVAIEVRLTLEPVR